MRFLTAKQGQTKGGNRFITIKKHGGLDHGEEEGQVERPEEG